jgi:heme exporter protein C
VGLYGAPVRGAADYQQGENFRILYVHVPAAWMSLFMFVGDGGAGADRAGLGGSRPAKILAMACAPVGAPSRWSRC